MLQFQSRIDLLTLIQIDDTFWLAAIQIVLFALIVFQAKLLWDFALFQCKPTTSPTLWKYRRNYQKCMDRCMNAICFYTHPIKMASIIHLNEHHVLRDGHVEFWGKYWNLTLNLISILNDICIGFSFWFRRNCMMLFAYRTSAPMQYLLVNIDAIFADTYPNASLKAITIVCIDDYL